MDWSNEASLELIRQYRRLPVLWNVTHGAHYSKVKKREAWDTIAFNMGLGVEEIRQKMNSLLGSFRRERSKMRRGEGRYGHGDFSSRWFAFDHLMFLLNRNQKIPDDKEYLEELLEKPEEEEGDLGLDSDSNLLLEEELNESSREAPTDTDKYVETPSPSSVQPPPSGGKRRKTVHYGDETLTAFPSANSRDECTIFAQYVTSKLKKLSDGTRPYVERAINNVLFEADLGKFDDLPTPLDVKQQAAATTFLNSTLDETNLYQHSLEAKPVQLSIASDAIQTPDIS